MANYHPEEKICATCNHWQGERVYKQLSDVVVVRQGEKASCRYSKKKFFLQTKNSPAHSCANWHKWVAL